MEKDEVLKILESVDGVIASIEALDEDNEESVTDCVMAVGGLIFCIGGFVPDFYDQIVESLPSAQES